MQPQAVAQLGVMKLQSIQILRAVAATAVVLSHIAAYERLYSKPEVYFQSLYYGSCGVDLFFVISGFVMAMTPTTQSTIQFLWNRASRIYPPYWFALAVFFGCAFAVPGLVDMGDPEKLSMVKTLFLVPQKETGIIIVAWTLMFELWFYLVFAVTRVLKLPLAFVVPVWIAVPVLATIFGPKLKDLIIPYQTVSPLCIEFIAGLLVAKMWQNTKMRFAMPVLLAGIALLTFSVFFVAPHFNIGKSDYFQHWRTLVFGLPAAMILYGAVGMEGSFRRLWSWMAIVGSASYSTYLLHIPALALSAKAISLMGLPGPLDNIAILLGGVLAANAVGIAVFTLFETRVLSLSRRLPALVKLAAHGAINSGLVWLSRRESLSAPHHDHVVANSAQGNDSV
ncbi:acyltransferase family protein [Rhizobium bangladeshense]|uniref:acyltransferase family protein n=1 Tax=Rhizobium bangladeshense TaxID=1138189 RepID=UPI001C835A4A|nr:acyltransferase [Rhizobium bangladeshense]MBX4889759.1 acyltransferase [Rhizobium bangladeshense]